MIAPSAELHAQLIAAFRNTYLGMFPNIGECCPKDGICESCALLVEKAEEVLASQDRALGEAQREKEHVGTNLEMANATLRGWRDFFSGQPKDMPFTEPGDYAKNSQLNFAWTVGYESAQESELFKTMVGRADRSAQRSQECAAQLTAAQGEIARLKIELEDTTAMWEAASKAIEQAEAERARLREVLKQVLASAHPHPLHHPTMFAAWKVGGEVLSTPARPTEEP